MNKTVLILKFEKNSNEIFLLIDPIHFYDGAFHFL